MEWAVWTASSDSEDATASEINEDKGAPSNRDQEYSLNGAREHSSSKDAQVFIDLTFVKEVAATRNGWDSKGPVKAEVGKKPSDNGGQDFIHFEKKQGIKQSAPDSMGSTCTVNISEGAGIPTRAPENITMLMMREEDDAEQVLVTEEDLGESTEELEFDSSTSMNGVSQKLNPGRSDVQRKKRNLTEDGHGQASKLVKRLEPPQENQLPCASTECGESASDPSCSQWNESFQSEHLAGNGAAEEPVNFTESQEMLSYSSELAVHQKRRNGKRKYLCPECNVQCRGLVQLNRHLLIEHEFYECPDCIKCCKTADGMSSHRRSMHKVKNAFECTECDLTFRRKVSRDRHYRTVHDTEGFKCPDCKQRFPNKGSLRKHRRIVHFRCTECNLTFNSELELNQHYHMAVGAQESFKCPECNTQFFHAELMKQHRFVIHNVKEIFSCPDCMEEFISLDSLTEHQVACTGEQPVQCTECHIIFENESRLSQHQFEVHNIKRQISCTDYTEAFSVDETFDWE